MTEKINQHFYFDGDKKFNNDCNRCCMNCQYNIDDKNKQWTACSESCMYLIGYSCQNCKRSTYGQKI